jgi:hypothetical protein
MIYTNEVLKQIGFKELHNPDKSDFIDSFEYDFGSFKLKVRVLMNRRFKQVYHFSGILKTERSNNMIDFEVPMEVESFEQGVAYISYGLGSRFNSSISPQWYLDGLNWKNQLPWLKANEEFRNTPSAYIQHDYFKLIEKKMSAIAINAKEDETTTFSFDGEILRIVCSGNLIVTQAVGKAWTSNAVIKTKTLIYLPKRIRKDGISIYIWKDNLNIGNTLFSLISTTVKQST